MGKFSKKAYIQQQVGKSWKLVANLDFKPGVEISVYWGIIDEVYDHSMNDPHACKESATALKNKLAKRLEMAVKSGAHGHANDDDEPPAPQTERWFDFSDFGI